MSLTTTALRYGRSRAFVPYGGLVVELSDSEVRETLMQALAARGMDPQSAEATIDRWQGDHDYRAWQRGYQEAMIFASNLLLDAADDADRR